MPGDELAVDDLVAVDRLGHQPRQRALGPLAVDGVEAEGDAEQRPEDAEELVERRHAVGRQREQVEEDRRRLRGGVGGVADRPARRVHRRPARRARRAHQDHEAHRADVVGRTPCGRRCATRRGSAGGARVAVTPPSRRSRLDASQRRAGHRSRGLFVGPEPAVVDGVEVGAVASEVGEAAAGVEDGALQLVADVAGDASSCPPALASGHGGARRRPPRAARSASGTPVTPTVKIQRSVELGGQLVDRAGRHQPARRRRRRCGRRPARPGAAGATTAGPSRPGRCAGVRRAAAARARPRGRCSRSARRGSGSTGP